MASCLGLYVDSNVIKYAKVSRDKDNLKIESFGMKFYDKLSETIDQIISETFSYKTPISINLSEEMYNYFYMFNLLNKNDLKKAIQTEFESYCADKNLNRNAFESRYALSNSIDDKDKLKVIYVSTNKITINKIMQLTENASISTITPIGMSIANAASIKPKENVIIVNIEDRTTVTTIVNQKIYDVQKYEEGSQEILDKINEKENSYSKAYEICKNSTIYTMEGRGLQDEENEYLDDIMPTLYKIMNRVKDYIEESSIKFDKIYITGMMSTVNNIDLYFQEFFTTEKCEILKPYFVTENIKINMKDYIEVNSAIAIALQGLGYGIKDMNFKHQTFVDKMPEWMKITTGKKGEEKANKKFNFNINFGDLKEKLDATEKWLLRGAGGILMLTILYSAFTVYLNRQINKKMTEVRDVYQDTIVQIGLAEQDITSVREKTNKYDELRQNLQNINDRIDDLLKSKNQITNLLMQIMSTIPQGVQITDIQNTTGKKIVIRAQANQYEQLGYFKAKLKDDNILDNVVSSPGQKDGDLVKVTIEGDLP